MKTSKRILIYIVIIVLLILLCGVMFYWIAAPKESGNNPSGQNTQIVIGSNGGSNLVISNSFIDIKDETGASPFAGRNIYFSGFPDTSLINEKSVVYLENPSENEDFLMKYEVIIKENDKEKTIYETDLIPSGCAEPWIAYDSLGVGEFDVILKMTPFWYLKQKNEYYSLTNGANEIHFIVVKSQQ